MKVATASTQIPDPYRAGLSLAESVRHIEPELLFVFFSAHYERPQELIEAIYENMNNPRLIVFGGTGDGFYTSESVEDFGATCLALSSKGKLRWTLEKHSFDTRDVSEQAAACGKSLVAAHGEAPRLCFILSTHKVNGSALALGLNRSLGTTPVIGGFTADDRKIQDSLVIANGEILRNGMALLACSGDFNYSIASGSGWIPTGTRGMVTRSEGTRILEIDGQKATAFFEKQLGQSLGFVDKGTLGVAAYGEGGSFILRAVSNFDTASGFVELFGAVEKNQSLRICTATQAQIEDTIPSILEQHLRQTGVPEFEPALAFVVSCAGRKWILGERTRAEVDELQKHLRRPTPIIGFPSLGEFSPQNRVDGSYSQTHFHNVTYVSLLMGE